MLEELDEGPEAAAVPRSVQLRRCSVLGDNFEADPDFPTGVFEVPPVPLADGTEVTTIAVIALLEVSGRVVLVLPHRAYHRILRQRLVPPGALLKPFAAEVPFCDRDQSAFDVTGSKKVWIATLAPEFEDRIYFDHETFEPTVPDLLFDPISPSFVPTADGLQSLGQEFFGFESATSGLTPGDGGTSVDARLKIIEASVQSLADSVKALRAPAVPLPPRPSALKSSSKAAPSAPPTSSTCPPPGLESPMEYAGSLDLDVVRSARQAGIPESQIAEMASLAARGRGIDRFPKQKEADRHSAGFVRQRGRGAACSSRRFGRPWDYDRRRSDSCSGKADRDCRCPDQEQAPRGNPRSTPRRRWVSRLFRDLATARKPEICCCSSGAAQSFEEQAGGALQDPRAQHGGRFPCPVSTTWIVGGEGQRKGLARNAVQSTTVSYPSPTSLGSGRDIGLPPSGSRCRSQSSLRTAPGMGDQLSIDRGSWLIAGEMSLEDAPPMGSFASHTLPTDAEPPYSKLIDGRWFDLFLQKLSDYDQLQERKRRLASRKTNPAAPNAEAIAKAEPKKKGKGKGKSKASASGSADAEDAPATAS